VTNPRAPTALKNDWSSTAGLFGFVVAIVLGFASDIQPNFVIGILCPTGVILARLLGLFHVGVSYGWTIISLVAVDAIGNAFWYMLVTEAVRLLLAELNFRRRPS
jgi:hypothetical protein